jgi:two-component system NtrC family sensor kinase
VKPGRFLKDPKDVVVALRLLVLAGLAMLGIGQAPEHRFLFWFTTVVYGATNLGYLFSRAAHFVSPRVQLAVFLFDVVIVSFLIVMRGSQVPQFIMAYFTLVLMAAVVQNLGTVILNALFVCTVYAAVTLWGEDPASLLTFPVLAQFAFFIVIAIFMGQVAEASREQAREHAQAEVVNEQLEAKVAEKTADLRRSLEELASARTRLQAADRLATLGMLSAGIAHEIRNPLAAIRACLDEAPELLDDLERAGLPTTGVEAHDLLRSAVSDCSEACSHLQRIASDLTAVARTTPTEPRPVKCAEALEGTARMLRHRAKDGLRIVVDCKTERACLADPGRLQQVFLNLAGNGLDAMETTGGTLTLVAEDAGSGLVRFRIEDTGVGMTPEVRSKIFAAFFTTKGAGKGTGLGMHLVQEIVQAHGGRIEFDSEQGKGTRFRLEWPAAAEVETTSVEGGHDDVRQEALAARR